MTQLEARKDRYADEETYDFLPLPAWGPKINFYVACFGYNGTSMPSSAFKMLEATEYMKLFEPVFDCDVRRARVIDFSDTLRSWSGYLGCFLEYQMLRLYLTHPTIGCQQSGMSLHILICN